MVGKTGAGVWARGRGRGKGKGRRRGRDIATAAPNDVDDGRASPPPTCRCRRDYEVLRFCGGRAGGVEGGERGRGGSEGERGRGRSRRIVQARPRIRSQRPATLQKPRRLRPNPWPYPRRIATQTNENKRTNTP